MTTIANSTATLNSIIFNNVLKYLLNDKFKRLLEYSLLSKFIFKILSSQLKHYSNLFLPILSFNSLKKYIGGNSDTISNYEYKLIQYKEIEYLSLVNPKEELGPIKEFLVLNCPNLKSTRIFNKYETKFYKSFGINDYKKGEDDSCDGFFTFDNVLLVWGTSHYPISNKQESTIVKDYTELDLICHPFTFEILNKLQPRVVNLDTVNTNGRILDLYKIDNILNQKSIETLKFNNQLTPLSFFQKALSLNNIKSLTVILHFRGNEIPFETITSNDNDNYDDSLEIIGFAKDLNSIFKQSGLINNTSLKRLKINGRQGCNGDNPKYLFHLLSNNNQLKALGLEIYNIKNKELLEPLNQFTNITVLYCNIESVKCFLLHILSNSNIKKLKFKATNENNFSDYTDIFTQFFQRNKTLESITVVSNSDIIPNFTANLVRLSRTFNDSICKIKYKFI